MSEKRILLVEDNDDDVQLTLRALKRSRVANDIVVSPDGADALDWLFCNGRHEERDPGDQPALVLLDLKLPKVDGFQVLERIRTDERTRLVPVVVLTSSKEEEDRLRGYALGANSYVQKPVSFEDFCEAVEEIGLYWLLLNQPVPPRGE